MREIILLLKQASEDLFLNLGRRYSLIKYFRKSHFYKRYNFVTYLDSKPSAIVWILESSVHDFDGKLKGYFSISTPDPRPSLIPTPVGLSALGIKS